MRGWLDPSRYTDSTESASGYFLNTSAKHFAFTTFVPLGSTTLNFLIFFIVVRGWLDPSLPYLISYTTKPLPLSTFTLPSKQSAR